MKYQVEVTEIGAMVHELLDESECLIIYNNNVADLDLREISVTHTLGEVISDICSGDTLIIGEQEYRVTCVGDIAQKTLRELGHCTLKFDGEEETNLPGELHVIGVKPDIKVGDIITFK